MTRLFADLIRLSLLPVLLICCITLFEQPSIAAEEALPVARVAIFDYVDGTGRGAKTLKRFLTPANGFAPVVVTPDEIQQGVLADFNVLIMPGGSASKQSNALGETGREAIRKFVDAGGGYVGICAGAYLASSNYNWSLWLVNARVWDRTHWARGTGQVTLCLSPDGCELLKSDDRVDVYYGQGPLLMPDNQPHLPGYQVLATYETEVAKKGAPEGAMTDTHAIVRTKYGKGRVICYSPHPESSNGPNYLMLHGVRWASGVDELIPSQVSN